MHRKVSELLKEKSGEIISITENKRLKDVVKFYTQKKIGALIVLDDDKKVKGIISERDIIRKLAQTQGEIKNLRVKRIMTSWENLIIATPDDDLDYLMKIMTKNRIRHVPVVIDKCSNLNLQTEFLGVISIGDVVKSLIDNLDKENKMLRDYVKEIYPTKY
jgi:CBS domain-containing protein